MKKLLTITVAALILLLLCTAPGFAAMDSVRDYAPAQFADVDEDTWSAPYIAEVYSLGLMNGTGETLFDPRGYVSVAQSVTVAARLNDLFSGGDGVIEGEGEHWYDPSVLWATEKGIVQPGLFDGYERPATRAEIALLLVRALPASEFKAIREVAALPDVTEATPCAAEIFTLYRAGILTGNDVYGTFTPASELTREALAAILCRVCRSETRVSTAIEEMPPDMTARTCSLLVELNGIPLYGAVTVAGDYYLPLALFDGNESLLANAVNHYGNTLSFIFNHRYQEVTAADYTLAPPDWVALGTAERAEDYQLGDKTVRHMTLGGHYDMFSLADVSEDGLSFEDGRIIVNIPHQNGLTVNLEEDLVGQATAPLLRGTTRDTLKAIHDYLVKTLSYSYPAQQLYKNKNNNTLANRMGVCENYACLFMEMCTRAGIPCEFIGGAASNGPHAWNRVWVDGEWLYVDVTWDDPIGGSLNYNYFLVGPDKMVISRVWEGDDYPFDVDYDPAWEELDPKKITTADMFRKCLLAQIAVGVRENGGDPFTVSLHCSSADAYGGTGCLNSRAGRQTGWYMFYGGYDPNTANYVFHINDPSYSYGY